jgi:hypothetical protein
LGKILVVHPFPAKNHFVPPRFYAFGTFDGKLNTIEARLTGPDNRVIKGDRLDPEKTKNKIWAVHFDLTKSGYDLGTQFLLLVRSTDGMTQPVLLDGLVLRDKKKPKPKGQDALGGPVIEFPNPDDIVLSSFLTYGWGTADLKAKQSVWLETYDVPPQPGGTVDPIDPSAADWLAMFYDVVPNTYKLQVIDVMDQTTTADNVHVVSMPTFMQQRLPCPRPVRRQHGPHG